MPARLYSKATHAVRYFLLRRLPACKQMTALMSASFERRLKRRERVELKLHLWVCAWCAWYLEQLRLLQSAARLHAPETADDEMIAPAPAASLSYEARERIKRALDRPLE